METWLYILALEGPEDLLKVGLSRRPLPRWAAFHPRWYEAFDLGCSLLVGCETRGDAQRLETSLHRQLRVHGSPMPLTIRPNAAGSTEWYRGAYPHACRFVAECEAAGYGVERDVPAFLLPMMRADADRLDAVIRQAHAALLAGWLSETQRRSLLDWVEGHLHFQPQLRAVPIAEFTELRGGSWPPA